MILATIILVAGAAILAALATWALHVLADDPAGHCPACHCHTTPAVLYDYQQDPTCQHDIAS